jgi:hypothetical protein
MKCMNRFLLLVVSTLFSFGFLLSTDDILQLLKNKYAEYNSTFNRTKIDILFNQPQYVVGDTAFYRIYYLKASDLHFSQGSEIIHIILFDSNGRVLIKNEMLARDGYGNGQIVFGNDILPGSYLLVAYSDWMKNLDKSLFFKKEINIVGQKVLKKQMIESIPTIDAFPEGGNWVVGIENNIVLSVKDCDFSGDIVIKNGQEQIIARSTVDIDGFTEMKLKMERDRIYTVEYLLRERLIASLVLPDPRSEGLGIQVSFSDDFKPTLLTIQCPIEFNLEKKNYVLLTNAQKVIFSSSLNFTEGQGKILLPKNIPSGISQVCVFDEDLKFLAERLIYVGAPNDININLEMSDKHKTRDKADINISIQDKEGMPLNARFSVRIFNAEILKQSEKDNANILIDSDLSFSQTKTSMESNRDINKFLVTQKCKWLNWNNILKNQRPLYIPQRYQTFSGRAYEPNKVKPLKDSTLLSFFLKGEMVGYEGYVSNNGRFQVPLFYNFFGKDEIFCSASYKGHDIADFTLSFDYDSIDDFHPQRTIELDELDIHGDYVRRKRIIDQSYNFYSNTTKSNNNRIKYNDLFEEELGGADVIVNLKDYVVFPTMSELIREVVRSVEHRRVKDKDIIRVYTTQKRPSNFAQPLFIIDGILTKNTALFLDLNPADVLTLKVIKDSNKLTRFGSLGENGVIVVSTRNPIVSITNKEKNTFEFTGLSDTTLMKPIKKHLVHTPDMRLCLYWNPDLTVNSEGKSSIKFLTSDKVGNYVVQIQGLTADGRPFFNERYFTVSYKQ